MSQDTPTGLALPDPASVSIESAAGLASDVVAWCETCEALPALMATLDDVALIESYLAGRNEEAAREIARARRLLEVRIGRVLGPAVVGSHSSASEGGERLKANDRMKFRSMAEHANLATVAEKIEAGASRAAVLAAIKKATTLPKVEHTEQETQAQPTPEPKTMEEATTVVGDALSSINAQIAVLQSADEGAWTDEFRKVVRDQAAKLGKLGGVKVEPGPRKKAAAPVDKKGCVHRWQSARSKTTGAIEMTCAHCGLKD